MTVNLGSTFDEFITEMLKAGYYQSPSEVVLAGLQLLKDHEQLRQIRLADLRKEIAIGISSAERGDVVDGPLAFAKLRARIAERKRLAE